MVKIILFAFLALLIATVAAQRPSTTSICDYYANALTFADQEDFIAFFVDAAINNVVTNYITLPYFNGTIGENSDGESINYLATANADDLASLRAGLISFFGRNALGCTDGSISEYTGEDMAETHKNNQIDKAAWEVFNQQLVVIAQVYGFTHDDYDTLSQVLESFRGDICTEDDCFTSPYTIQVGLYFETTGSDRYTFFNPSFGYNFPRGTTITWIWANSGVNHNVIQDTGYGNCSALAGGFASPTQTYGNWSYTFTEGGTYYYFCSVGTHCSSGGMYGQITISGGGGGSGAASYTIFAFIALIVAALLY